MLKFKIKKVLAPKEGEPDNSTIVAMRQSFDKMKADFDALKEANTTLATEKAEADKKLKEIELNKLGEVERLTALNKELNEKLGIAMGEVEKIEPLQKRILDLNSHVELTYEAQLSRITDETKRKEIKSITLVEGDPIASASKLNSTLKVLFGEDSLKVGSISVPGPGPDPDKTKEKEGKEKILPKDMTWSKALRPVSEILGKEPKQV